MANIYDENLQILCKQMVKTRVFLGHYQEKRFVDSLQSYRDIIAISVTEKDLINDMDIIKKRITKAGHLVWIGFTDSSVIGAPVAPCLWTKLEHIPFGEYWFQIKTIRFRDTEILIKLKMLRPKYSMDQQVTKKTIPQPNLFDFSPYISGVCDTATQLSHDLVNWIQERKFDKENFITSLKLFSLLVIGTLTASWHFVGYVGKFSLQFMDLMIRLIHVSMPLLLSLVDLLNKIIGGIFILIAMIWRDTFGSGSRSRYSNEYHAIPRNNTNPRLRNGRPNNVIY